VAGDELANFLGVSRAHLSRLVSQLHGTTVRDYLRAKQLAYAQTLLRTTPSSIDVIARKSAFGTAWTFNRCFRRAFGMTPAQYRRTVTK
jgi:AraC-like DNA-binding protein